jgi:hypothetical protein
MACGRCIDDVLALGAGEDLVEGGVDEAPQSSSFFVRVEDGGAHLLATVGLRGVAGGRANGDDTPATTSGVPGWVERARGKRGSS